MESCILNETPLSREFGRSSFLSERISVVRYVGLFFFQPELSRDASLGLSRLRTTEWTLYRATVPCNFGYYITSLLLLQVYNYDP